MRTFSFLAVAAFVLAACSSSSSVGTECTAAGGKCISGGVPCGKSAPAGSDDCETSPPNPAGNHCCLSLADGG